MMDDNHSPTVHKVLRWFEKLFRLWPAWIMTIALTWVIYAISPQQVPVTLYKVLLLTAGAILGFWAHVWAEGHVDELTTKAMQEAAKTRRMGYIVGGMIAFALAA